MGLPSPHNPSSTVPFLLSIISFVGCPFNVFDDLLARAFACSSCLSHLPLLSGDDVPETLSVQIILFGYISPDVRQKLDNERGDFFAA